MAKGQVTNGNNTSAWCSPGTRSLRTRPPCWEEAQGALGWECRTFSVPIPVRSHHMPAWPSGTGGRRFPLAPSPRLQVAVGTPRGQRKAAPLHPARCADLGTRHTVLGPSAWEQFVQGHQKRRSWAGGLRAAAWPATCGWPVCRLTPGRHERGGRMGRGGLFHKSREATPGPPREQARRVPSVHRQVREGCSVSDTHSLPAEFSVLPPDTRPGGQGSRLLRPVAPATAARGGRTQR